MMATVIQRQGELALTSAGGVKNRVFGSNPYRYDANASRKPRFLKALVGAMCQSQGP